MVYRKPMSVGQVAEILHMSNKSVLNWIHAGALKAFTTYGGHFRIWPADLERFLETSKMSVPFDFVDERHRKILIIDEDSGYANQLQAIIDSNLSGFDVMASQDGYEGILMIGEHHPKLLILGVDSPNSVVLNILGLLKSRKRKNGMKIMLICGDQEVAAKINSGATCVDFLTQKGENSQKILQRIKEIVAGNSNGNSHGSDRN